LECQRLEQRTHYDLEMLKESGYCHGIENYSRHLEFRGPGQPPFTLLDYFPDDFLCVIDESHLAMPQLKGMFNTDRARKKVLIEHGFRLPSALDNRPLGFAEFEKKVSPVIYVSATPGPYELRKIQMSKSKCQIKSKCQMPKENPLLIELLIRPTGLLEPSIEIRPTKNQVKNLIEEIRKRIKKGQRTLALTLTKRLAEDLADYLAEEGIKTSYLHSEIKTLARPEILKKFRQGEYDVLCGINLLREGLDLPEVALIAILDADKEGFLRNETTLIQTMGRAARHTEGTVILYADKLTGSIKSAIAEVKRRRKIQVAYNKKHHLTPKPIIKPIRDWPFASQEKEISVEFGTIKDIGLLEKEMRQAAKNLDFERAAEIRDIIKKLKDESRIK
jgi:excinuclease ABC subunit B